MQTILVLEEPEFTEDVVKGIKEMFKGQTMKLTIEVEDKTWEEETYKIFVDGYDIKDSIYDKI